jgi:hypothetical protein
VLAAFKVAAGPARSVSSPSLALYFRRHEPVPAKTVTATPARRPLGRTRVGQGLDSSREQVEVLVVDWANIGLGDSDR